MAANFAFWICVIGVVVTWFARKPVSIEIDKMHRENVQELEQAVVANTLHIIPPNPARAKKRRVLYRWETILHTAPYIFAIVAAAIFTFFM